MSDCLLPKVLEFKIFFVSVLEESVFYTLHSLLPEECGLILAAPTHSLIANNSPKPLI
jgi:hypothetical protein